MVASVARIKISSITERAGEILNQPGWELHPNVRQEFQSAQQTLASIERDISRADSVDIPPLILLREYIETLTNLVLPFSRAVKKSSVDKWNQLSRKVHKFIEDVESLNRMLDLFDPSQRSKIEKTIKWILQQGTTEHLDALLQAGPELYDHVEDIENLRGLTEAAIRKISERERVCREFDPDGGLQKFFDLNQEEFAQIMSDPGWETKISPSLHEYTPARTLQLIKENLEILVGRNEIDRWLNAPNPKFDGETPVKVIKQGRAFGVLQLLVRLVEGIHD